MEALEQCKSRVCAFHVENVNDYLFCETSVELNFWILDMDTKCPQVGGAWLVDVYVAYDQQQEECKQSPIDIISCSGIDSSGRGSVKFSIRDLSFIHDSRQFCLMFYASNRKQTIQGRTNSFLCVRYKLSIVEEHLSPYIWYKDEGGKGKCIEILVKLVDNNNAIVLGRSVALRAVLFYVGGQPVLHQEILMIGRGSSVRIDKNIGSAKVRLRINEVSHIHQGQLFQILICSLKDTDVCPVLSTPVEVRTKRHHANTKPIKHYSGSSSTFVNSVGTYPLALGHLLWLDNERRSIYSDTANRVMKRIKLNSDEVAKEAANNSSSLLSSSCVGEVEVVSTENPIGALQPFSQQCDSSLEMTSIRSIVRWTQKVLSSLQDLQWIQIGFECSTTTCNNTDSRGIVVPVFQMNNPNDRIKETITMYNDYAKEGLEYLKTKIDTIDNNISN